LRSVESKAKNEELENKVEQLTNMLMIMREDLQVLETSCLIESFLRQYLAGQR